MDVVAQAAAGLQAAHAKGLVHCDIKPGNLLLAASGAVKITDCGVSHVIGSTPSTVTGIVTGTAEYLAPERIAGAETAPASDLYALGVVAYECLAGAPPFVGEPPDVACAHRDHPVPPLPGSVPADVSTLVMQLVAKDPARRPDSAAEVAQQAGRLRHDLRNDLDVDADPAPYPLAVAAAVPPPPPLPAPAMAPAPAADDAWRHVPAAPRPASRGRMDARRLRRGPVLVLISVALAGLIGMVLAVTVGVVSVNHVTAAPPSARPGHSTSGTAAGSPAHQPSSPSPSRSARPGSSPGDTGTVPVVVSNQRTVTGSVTGRERTHRHRNGRDTGQGHGNGNRHGHGHGNGQGEGNGNGQLNDHGHGHGNGNGQGEGNGNGHGNGNGQGNGHGNGNGQGNGNVQVLSISS
jgi:serine/threonine-protein kinase